MAKIAITALLKSSELRGQVFRFLVVGSANTAFSYSIYSLGIYFGLRYYLASLIALILGILLSFVTQGRLVFGANLKGRFWIFVAVWAALYLVNIAAIGILSTFGVNYYWAGFAALIPTTLLSFYLQKTFVFPK